MDQTAVNVQVAIKREDPLTPGTPAAAGGGAIGLRLTDSPGLVLGRNAIQSGEHRANKIRRAGRHGSRTVTGSYNLELTVGGAVDDISEAAVRGTWSAALPITTAGAFAGATLTVATAGGNSTITASAGSFLTAGIRVGDMVTPSGMTQAANNRRLRVSAVTALVLTFNGVVLTAEGPSAGWTITRMKKLITPSTSPTDYAYTIEQYNADIDRSELFIRNRVSNLAISMRPNAIATFVPSFVGMDRNPIVPASAPWFTSASVTSGEPLVADDAAVFLNGAVIAKLSGFDLTLAIATAGQPVIGSQSSPEIYANDSTLTGSIMGIREDFTRITMYDAETRFSIGAWFPEPGGEPTSGIGIYIPYAKITTLEAPARGSEGPMIETMGISFDDIPSAADTDNSAINFFSTAA
jgi:hypothetical protein